MVVSTIVMNNSQEHVKSKPIPIFFIYSARNIVGDDTCKSKWP